MKELLIIGARGYGREVYNWLTQCKEYNQEWCIKGFLDDNHLALTDFNYAVPIIGSVEDYIIQKNDVFICAIGSVQYKKKYTEIILANGGEFINLIHPLALLHDNIKLGKGLIICPFSTISNEVSISDFVTIQGYVALGHDVSIGKWSHINAYSFVGGYGIIEEEVTLHTRSTVLPKIKVEKGAVVGAGSVVIKNVKSKTTVFGIPAKIIF